MKYKFMLGERVRLKNEDNVGEIVDIGWGMLNPVYSHVLPKRYYTISLEKKNGPTRLSIKLPEEELERLYVWDLEELLVGSSKISNN
jgi:hypothetical protein